MPRFAVLLCVLVSLFVPAVVAAETPPEQDAAVKALSGIASNIQKNRDGTVRFVRFSKAVVTDEHVAQVAAFKQLDYLAVVTPTVTDAGLQAIAGLTNLDTLFLSDSGLTDATLSSPRGSGRSRRSPRRRPGSSASRGRSRSSSVIRRSLRAPRGPTPGLRTSRDWPN